MKRITCLPALVGVTISILCCFGCSVETGPIYFPDGVSMENNESYNKANIAFQQRQTQQGLSFLKQAAQEGYRHPFVYARLANQSGYLEKYDEALAYSQRAIEIIESKNIKVMFPNELEAFKKENRPRTTANIYSLHALILYELGRTDPADSFAQKAYSLHSDDPRAREVLGKLAIDKKNYDKAISIFQDFVQRAPKYADAYFHLGRALLASGKTDEGRAALQTYLTRVPASHPKAQKAKTLLQGNAEGPHNKPMQATPNGAPDG
jgi:tetratricopeptide (TPR) repeat protein